MIIEGKYMKYLICLVALISCGVHAESISYQAGKAVGSFAAGVGAASSEQVMRSVQNLQPEWITIQPKTKQVCLKESQGELNKIYMRCRNGWQEYVRFDEQGRKVVLSERAIPSYP
jgi:ABC-type transport system involved in cytochrome bd biosynthesis fused ATPase/permease subunit